MTTPAVKTMSPQERLASLAEDDHYRESLSRTYRCDVVASAHDSMRREIEADLVKVLLSRAAHQSCIPTGWSIQWRDNVEESVYVVNGGDIRRGYGEGTWTSSTVEVSAVLVPVDVVLS
jgi:lysine/ornithine N-monooxygenase